jgi:hypothetical protein
MPQISDTVLIYCMLLPGIFLFIIGIKYYIKMFRLKKIVQFPMLQENKTFTIVKPGRYHIIVVGGSKIRNLPLRLISVATNKGIEVSNIFPAARTMHKGGIGVAYCEFFIDNPGEYSIIIENYNNISVGHYKMGPLAALQPDKVIPPSWLSLIVKEYTPPVTFIIALIGTILGINFIGLSIVFLMFNHGIIKPSKHERTTVTTYTF